jgi:hypothetical protein
MPFVLGHALSRQAIPGGKATNDQRDSPKLAALLRGGMRPHAYVDPAAMRATRALLRRRPHLRRQRAALLAHVHKTHTPYHVPAIGKNIASKAKRAGVAERFDDPAGHKTRTGDRALLTSYEPMLNDLALFILQTAQQHEAPTLSL